MANPVKLKLDHDGIAEHLKGADVAAAVRDYAERIATTVRGEHEDADVVVDQYTTDRAAASVTIRDRRGRIWQVRDGILTRAAAQTGLPVTDRHA